MCVYVTLVWLMRIKLHESYLFFHIFFLFFFCLFLFQAPEETLLRDRTPIFLQHSLKLWQTLSRQAKIDKQILNNLLRGDVVFATPDHQETW